jgi:hypothetical protein
MPAAKEVLTTSCINEMGGKGIGSYCRRQTANLPAYLPLVCTCTDVLCCMLVRQACSLFSSHQTELTPQSIAIMIGLRESGTSIFFEPE